MGADRPRVVLVYPLPDEPSQQRLASSGFDVLVLDRDDDETIEAALLEASAVVLHGPARVTAAAIERATRLKVIGALGAGTDNIDLDAARRHGVAVVSGGGVAPRAVAEYVIGASIAAHRDLVGLHQQMMRGGVEWGSRFEDHAGTSLEGRVFGVVGFGNIGREVARLATAVFDAPIVVFDPYFADPTPSGVTKVSTIDDVCEQSDTVAVNAALTPETRHLIRRPQLRRLGPGGVLVDAARGGLVHEDDLIACLKAGELKAAVLDVFDPEPPPADRLRRLGAVRGLTLTPHMAGATVEAQRALSESIVRKVTDHLIGSVVRRR